MIRSIGESTPKPTTQSASPDVKTITTPADKVDKTEPSAFQRVIQGLGKEINQGERTMRNAIAGRGGEMAPGELLALQAGVYRYGEVVDLASKLIDRTSSGVKTIIQGGGQ